MDKKYIVYMHVNKINSKKYIGITSQSPTKRWRSDGSGYKSSPHFWSSIQKYGWDNFEHIILFEGLTEDEAKAKEIELIAQYLTTNNECGYNSTKGGDGCLGRTMSDETREKLRQMNLGKKHTDEWKQHMREVMRGREMTDEWKQKISESHIGALNPSARKIVLIDNTYHLIKVYDCITEAANELNLHVSRIQSVCEKEQTNTGGYIFMYYEDYLEIKDSVAWLEPIKCNSYRKRVKQFDLSGNLINEYDSINDACRKTGANKDGVISACKGKLQTSAGFRWSYVS